MRPGPFDARRCAQMVRSNADRCRYRDANNGSFRGIHNFPTRRLRCNRGQEGFGNVLQKGFVVGRHVPSVKFRSRVVGPEAHVLLIVDHVCSHHGYARCVHWYADTMYINIVTANIM